MAGKLTARSLESRAKRKGRYSDGDGLFLRVMDPGRKAYWVYRYTISGKERERASAPIPACRWPMRASSTPICAPPFSRASI